MDERYGKICEAIEKTLLAARLQHFHLLDEPGTGLPLVDHLSRGDDISSGREEIELLAESLTDSVLAVLNVEAKDCEPMVSAIPGHTDSPSP